MGWCQARSKRRGKAGETHRRQRLRRLGLVGNNFWHYREMPKAVYLAKMRYSGHLEQTYFGFEGLDDEVRG